jgi:hypothetical protein
MVVIEDPNPFSLPGMAAIGPVSTGQPVAAEALPTMLLLDQTRIQREGPINLPIGSVRQEKIFIGV